MSQGVSGRLSGLKNSLVRNPVVLFFKSCCFVLFAFFSLQYSRFLNFYETRLAELPTIPTDDRLSMSTDRLTAIAFVHWCSRIHPFTKRSEGPGVFFACQLAYVNNVSGHLRASLKFWPGTIVGA